MKQPFRIPIWVFVFLALDLILIFTMAALLKAGEMAGIISLFPISGLTIGVYGGLSGALMRRGKFIIPKEIEQKPITEFPRLALTDLTGLTIDREVVILLDEPAQQLIFTTWGWKRILSFDQVVDVNLHTETIVRKKDPAMATAIGAAMGGTTGAMIGLAVGMTDDVERKERFELLYHPKEAHWETASISGTARKNSSMSAPAFVRKTRIALGLDKPDSPPTPIQKRGSL